MVGKVGFTAAATLAAAVLVLCLGSGAADAATAALAPAATAAGASAARPAFQRAARVEQRTLDDIVKAERDIRHPHGVTAALGKVETAEVTLLNARQAGDYKDPQSLKALEAADAVLRQGKAGGVRQDLRTAEGALRTPTVATTDTGGLAAANAA